MSDGTYALLRTYLVVQYMAITKKRYQQVPGTICTWGDDRFTAETKQYTSVHTQEHIPVITHTSQCDIADVPSIILKAGVHWSARWLSRLCRAWLSYHFFRRAWLSCNMSYQVPQLMRVMPKLQQYTATKTVLSFRYLYE